MQSGSLDLPNKCMIERLENLKECNFDKKDTFS